MAREDDPIVTTSSPQPNRLGQSLAAFEKTIQANRQVGQCSNPVNFAGGSVEDEAKPSFRVRERRGKVARRPGGAKPLSDGPRRRKSSAKVVRKLSNQLQDVIRQLKHAEVRNKSTIQKMIEDNTETYLEIESSIVSQPLDESDGEKGGDVDEIAYEITLQAEAAVSIQSRIRRYLALREFYRCLSAIIRIQCWVRNALAASVAEQIKEEKRKHVNSKARRRRVRFLMPTDRDTRMTYMKVKIKRIERRLDNFNDEKTLEMDSLRGRNENEKMRVANRVKAKMMKLGGCSSKQDSRKEEEVRATIQNLRTSNAMLRRMQVQLQTNIDEIRVQNERREKETISMDDYSKFLARHVIPMFEKENAKLFQTEQSCKNAYVPMWMDAIVESKLYGRSETKQKVVYRDCSERISRKVRERTSGDSSGLQESIISLLEDVEVDVLKSNAVEAYKEVVRGGAEFDLLFSDSESSSDDSSSASDSNDDESTSFDQFPYDWDDIEAKRL